MDTILPIFLLSIFIDNYFLSVLKLQVTFSVSSLIAHKR